MLKLLNDRFVDPEMVESRFAIITEESGSVCNNLVFVQGF